MLLGQTLPFPEPGVRLIKHDAVEAFAAQMTDFKTELDDAVANLDRHYAELKAAAKSATDRCFLFVDRALVIFPRDVPWTVRRAAALRGKQFLNRIWDTDKNHPQVKQWRH